MDDSVERVAVIGMAGRFPGARDVAEYWSNLCAGRESIAHLDEAELAAAGVDPAEYTQPDYVRAGSRMDGFDRFDAEFFGYTPREAQIMDPQHRLFLETAWHALEHSGHDAAQYAGTIGVFGGASTSSYLANVFSNLQSGAGIKDANVGIGSELGFLTTRVSHKLDLRGPSFPVQTACSSSLVALHLARESLLGFTCDVALAGGVSFKTPPGRGYRHTEGSFLSPDGHIRPFDAAAEGTVFGNGVGVVVLKRLSEAVADGDTIYAVIRGSAVNNDGAVKASFTAPSVSGQADVIADALADAEVPADTIGYVEAHGSGTKIGDSIEVRALTRAYRETTDGTGFCAIGSVKSNIGHLDAAAGIAGLIKTVLALHHNTIPASINYTEPNPDIDFDSTPFRVADRLQPWPETDQPRRAGVSAFGFGGTNAHVVLEQAPAPEPAGPGRTTELLVLSARTPQDLDQLTDNLVTALRNEDTPLADTAYTLAVGRRALPHRRTITASDTTAAATALENRDPAALIDGHSTTDAPPLAFVYTGQGAQHPGMGRELYDTEPTYRDAVDTCAELLKPHLDDLDIRTLLHESTDDTIHTTRYAQPALFTLEYALTRLWQSWGLHPTALLGHSLGQYVAATIAGILDLPDALRLIALRGHLMQQQPPGAMLNVIADRETITPLLGPDLSLAAHNSPKDCVVSGPAAAIDAFLDIADEHGLITHPIATSHAFHSPLMAPMLDDFTKALSDTPLHPPAIPIVSDTTGTWLTDDQATNPHHWAHHILDTIEFATAVTTLTATPTTLLEVGPSQTLTGLIRRTTTDHLTTSSLPHPRDRRGATETVQRTLGQLWTHGHHIDWTAYYQHQNRRRTAQPTYPFQPTTHWLAPHTETPSTGTPSGHPLLDDVRVQTMGQSIYATPMAIDRHWVLSEHRMLGEAIVPGTTYLEMARAAAEHHAGRPVSRIRDVDFLVPMLVETASARVAHITVRDAAAPDTVEFTVVSRPAAAGAESWVTHAKGVVEFGELAPVPDVEVAELIRRCTIETVDVAKRQIEHQVMTFGERWHGSLQTVHSGAFEALGRLDLPDRFRAEDQGYGLHPALLDLATGFSGYACLEAAATDRAKTTSVTDFFLPVGYDRIEIHHDIPQRGYSHIRPRHESDVRPDFRTVDVTIMDDDGVVAVEISGFATKRVTAVERTVQELRSTTRHHGVTWKPAPRGGAPVRSDLLVVVAPGADATELCAEARRRGSTVTAIDAATGEGSVAAYAAALAAVEPMPEHLVFVAAGAGQPAAPADDGADPLLEGGVHALFGLAKALHGEDRWPASLTVVAPWAAAVTGAEPDVQPASAALFGLAKVLGQEGESLTVRCVDVDDAVPAGSLVDELFTTDAPGLIALRGPAGRYRQELRSIDLRQPAEADPGGVFLITGGYGGLGLAIARHLGEQVAGARIALVGRSGLPPRAEWPAAGPANAEATRAVQAMEEAGAVVACLRGDVGDPADVARVVAEARAAFGAITCVVHAAGVAGDGFVFLKDEAVFRRTLAPKVRGSRLLDAATAEDAPLMILFGSTSAVFGAAGQSDYTAANAYLDAFAELRAARGRPTIAVDWTDWTEAGMAADHGVRRDQGFFRSIEVRDGVASFLQIMRAGSGRVIVGDINYELLAAAPPAVLEEQLRRSPLGLSPAVHQRIRSTRPAPAAGAARAAVPTVAVRLSGRDTGEYTPTEEKVARIWAQELGLAEVNVHENSFDLGGDSLVALRMATGIQLSLGVRVTIIDLFRYTTVAELAEHLDQLGQP